ncbi:peroxidase 57-like [Tripterygium wilfordii]|uniref:Peroxidase n=2 Tax=Tripterygium wilfordii TaxID=458696 RepID=A0A7J7BW33_TRIWF|nr:peroxidase 57-like [Tripterygium wilfordii]
MGVMKVSVLLFLFVLLPHVFADLRFGFYSSTCPRAESVVRAVVQRRFASDRSITAALLRMHFHDCFVNGCDASILIDSTPTTQSEKEGGPNQTVREYELIDEIKKALEAACPSTISCADIITLATRDAISLAGGPNYKVPTGRLDGLVSNAADVNLPGPGSSVSGIIQTFRAKGLTLNDMVTLLGAHTVGVAHCRFFQDRLSGPDPTMDPNLATKLNQICGSQSSSDFGPSAFLDQNTSFVFDNEYYNQIRLNKGILQIDQALASDRSTAGIVSSFASNGVAFGQNFAKAMVKMGNLVNNVGEIRKNCRVFNPKPQQQKGSKKF